MVLMYTRNFPGMYLGVCAGSSATWPPARSRGPLPRRSFAAAGVVASIWNQHEPPPCRCGLRTGPGLIRPLNVDAATLMRGQDRDDRAQRLAEAPDEAGADLCNDDRQSSGS